MPLDRFVMRKKILLPVIFFALAVGLYAHPHVFIKPSVKVLVKGNIISGIKVSWQWDQWSSKEVLRECDTNKDGFLNAQEIELVNKYYFANLRNFDYFTEIYINGRQIRIRKVAGFTASVDKTGIVRMGFTVPVESNLKTPAKVGLCFNDNTIYVAFEKGVVVLPTNGHAMKNFKESNYGYYGIQFLFLLY